MTDNDSPPHTTSTTTLQKVKSFAVERVGWNIDKLSADTRLLHDLGITGDDAEEFLIDFSKEFEVDLGDLDFDRHFGPETPFNPFMYVYLLFFEREALHFEPITLNDLAKAAVAKKWINSDHT